MGSGEALILLSLPSPAPLVFGIVRTLRVLFSYSTNKKSKSKGAALKTYLKLMEHVLTHGEKKEDRTGTGTLSVFGYQARYSLERFPLLTTKKVHLKSIIHELLWFLSGETNIQLDTVIDVQYDLVTLPRNFLTTSQTFELCSNTQNQSRFAFHPYTGSKYSVFDWRPSPTRHLVDF